MSKLAYKVEPAGTLWHVIDPNGMTLVTLPVKYKADDIADLLDAAYRLGAVAALKQIRGLTAEPALSVPEMLAGMGL